MSNYGYHPQDDRRDFSENIYSQSCSYISENNGRIDERFNDARTSRGFNSYNNLGYNFSEGSFGFSQNHRNDKKSGNSKILKKSKTISKKKKSKGKQTLTKRNILESDGTLNFLECLDDGSIVKIGKTRGAKQEKYKCLHCKIDFINQNHIQKGIHRDHIKHCKDLKMCFNGGIKAKEKDDNNEDNEEKLTQKIENEFEELSGEGWILLPVENYNFYCCLHCGVKLKPIKENVLIHLQSKHHQFHVRHCLHGQKCKKEGKRKISSKDRSFRKVHLHPHQNSEQNNTMKEENCKQNNKILMDIYVKKEVKEDDAKSLAEEIKKEVAEKEFAEGLKTGALLKCCVCHEICKRGVRTPCCGVAACRGCATTKITSIRGCWVEHCGKVGITTEELVNDMLLREAVDGFKKEGVVNQELARRIKENRDKMNLKSEPK